MNSDEFGLNTNDEGDEASWVWVEEKGLAASQLPTQRKA
jgi:hypothetical protein